MTQSPDRPARRAWTYHAIVVGLALGACEQPPDVVLRTQLVESVAGAAGQAPEVPEPTTDCEPELPATYTVLSSVVIDGCSFLIADTQTWIVLNQHIFSQTPPPVQPEVTQVDPVCALLQVPPVYGRVRPDSSNRDRVVVCPAYCELISTWLTDHFEEARGCLSNE